jgi:hypothetical protein
LRMWQCSRSMTCSVIHHPTLSRSRGHVAYLLLLGITDYVAVALDGVGRCYARVEVLFAGEAQMFKKHR